LIIALYKERKVRAPKGKKPGNTWEA